MHLLWRDRRPGDLGESARAEAMKSLSRGLMHEFILEGDK
jgi:hypothetical protein